MQLLLRLTLFPLLLVFALSSCKSGQTKSSNEELTATTTFILVRHAEKEEGKDPELTAAGNARAQRLSDQLKNEQISAVYSTATNRTMNTARPTATKHQVDIKTYDAANPAEFANQLISQHRGQTVLIVGHSNSTPMLANALSGKNELSRFDESDYGNLVTVNISAKGKKTLSTKRY
jgi:2,3-bisphosphoglycerate-dependent phosphoglycerate mutase